MLGAGLSSLARTSIRKRQTPPATAAITPHDEEDRTFLIIIIVIDSLETVSGDLPAVRERQIQNNLCRDEASELMPDKVILYQAGAFCFSRTLCPFTFHLA